MIEIFLFIIGAVLGSFLCLAAERIPLNQSILFPKSHCSFCKKSLLKRDLIPLFSILLLRFRCRYCHKRLSYIYFFSELCSGWLFIICLSNQVSWSQLFQLLLFLFALTLSLTDCFYFIVEPKIFYSVGLLICLGQYLLGYSFYLVTGLFIVFSMLSICRLFPHSMGGGDVLFIGLFSLILEATIIFRMLFIASGLGLLFFLASHLANKKAVQLPFIPFLSIGLYISILFP